MRFLAAILLLRAMSTHVVNCASAADDSSSAAREVCSTSDADGTATCNRQDDVVVVDGGGVRDAVVTSSCIDLDPKCPSYEAEGACKSNPGYMTHYCARTCGYACDNGIDATPKCKDDNYQCLEWAGMGECDINPR
jgi:predicted metal-binding protein